MNLIFSFIVFGFIIILASIPFIWIDIKWFEIGLKIGFLVMLSPIALGIIADGVDRVIRKIKNGKLH